MAGVVPANAAFTAAEQTEMIKLRDALSDMSWAIRYLGDAMRTGTTTATRTPLADSVGLLILAVRDAEVANGLLLDVTVEQRGTSAFTALEAQTRSARVALAWWRLDRSVTTLANADVALSRAFQASTNTVYRDNIRRAREIWIVAARRSMLWMNRALRYADPNPVSFPKVIGPHGDYDRSQWYLWRSHWYALDMLDAIAAAYRADTTQASYWSVYKTISSATSILDAHVYAAGTLAGLTLTPHQVGQDPFFRILDELETMTEDTPERYHEIQRELAAWIGQGRVPTLGALSQSLIRLTDSWRHADHGVWRQLVFPECTTATGCGGR
jgi:hypothetical protein